MYMYFRLTLIQDLSIGSNSAHEKKKKKTEHKLAPQCDHQLQVLNTTKKKKPFLENHWSFFPIMHCDKGTNHGVLSHHLSLCITYESLMTVL